MTRSTMVIPSLVLCLALSFAAVAQAPVTVNQDGTGDYTTITAALGSVYPEIVVYPGVYQENITISRPVTLRAYDGPYLTRIDGGADASKPVITIADSISDVKVIGFHIANGFRGIYVGNHSLVEIASCVVENNAQDGIYVYWYDGTSTSVHIHNNVCVGNGGAGIYLYGYRNNFNAALMYCWIINNIIVSNTGYALAANTAAYADRVTVDYNNIYLNLPPGYDVNFGGAGVQLGAGMTNVDPEFIGSASGSGKDVRLQSTSPCKDEGSPSVTFNDPDGTRNDMGAYGGPYSATFFESPADGPIVREVTVTPGPVPQGDTFTIEATVAVR